MKAERKQEPEKVQKITHGRGNPNPWTDAESKSLIEALREHGKAWKKVTEQVSTRDIGSVRSKAQQLVLMFEKNSDHPDAGILSILKGPIEKTAQV